MFIEFPLMAVILLNLLKEEIYDSSNDYYQLNKAINFDHLHLNFSVDHFCYCWKSETLNFPKINTKA